MKHSLKELKYQLRKLYLNSLYGKSCCRPVKLQYQGSRISKSYIPFLFREFPKIPLNYTALYNKKLDPEFCKRYYLFNMI